jgi:fatty-acyl-CoA synthase
MHGTGQWTSLSPLLQGGSVVLVADTRFSPESVWTAVADHRATVLVMVGDVMGRPLADALAGQPDRWDLGSRRIAITSGAPLSATVRGELTALLPGLRILNRLGSSESGTVAEAADGGHDTTTSRFTGGDDTAVLDDDLRPLAPGDGRTGRLAKRGAIPLGYHGDPERTAATFVTDPDGVRWVLPGDFATVLADGSIALLGRGATTINSGGEKIYPQEVEAALKTHPDVFDAIVVGVPDERFGESVAALVQPRPGTTPTLDALDAHCRSIIAGYKVPRRLQLTDRLPLTAVGKPDPFAAREWFAGP